jgi:hypothetical protein
MRFIVANHVPEWRVAVFLLVAVMAAGLQGCGSSSSSFEEQLQRVASTASGATLLVEAWCDGSVPRAYAVSTVVRAGKNLSTISGTLAASTAPAARVQAARQEIVQLEAAIATAKDALDRQDRDGARAALGMLRQLESEARRQTLAEASS